MSTELSGAQLPLQLRTWGGKRRNSGPKPKGLRPLVRHRTRPRLGPSTPVHVTIRMRPEIRSLRNKHTYRVIASALTAGGERFGLRVVHHSVQANHVHVIAEADDAHALSRGMQGLSIRIAKRVNALVGRHGKVLADRYHCHVLRTPREARNALLYVLNNARKHARQAGMTYPGRWLDPYSSAARFDGWTEQGGVGTESPADGHGFRRPRVWLLCVGWRRHGLLPMAAVPSSAA